MDKRVTFENRRGEKLVGVLHSSPVRSASLAGAVLCHGMESNKSSAKIVAMSNALRERGLTALRFDFAGSGESGGDFADISYSGQVDDLSAAVAHLKESGIEHVGLIGSSMGGTVALLYAGSRMGVQGLATIAAPSDPFEVVRQVSTEQELAVWEERGFVEYHGRRLNKAFLDDIRQLDIVGAASRITCPVLLIHGDADETVPVAQAYRVYEVLRGHKQLRILHGADHRLSEPVAMKAAMHDAQDWIAQHVRAE